MYKLMKKTFLYLMLCAMLTGALAVPAAAYNVPLACEAAILVEETTGKVLYEKNADKRMFPASLTKILTVLVTLEYLSPDAFVVTGDEIYEVPYDSSKAFHVEGETLLVENLIRGLMIPSGNETACVAARAVARRAGGVTDISYPQAEAEFSKLMNEYAKGLGATGTNFVNPHGYHDDNHYTTARDMAVISRAAMGNELIRKISAEKEFIGNGAGEDADPAWKTQEYIWPTHNALIVNDSEFYYSYAQGIKTGYTGEAGNCLAAVAEKDGRRLIAIVMNDAEEADRWYDARALFEFGFNTFDDRTIQARGDILGEVGAAGVRLGEDSVLGLVAAEDVTRYMSEDEAERVSREISLAPGRVAAETEEEAPPIGDAQAGGPPAPREGLLDIGRVAAPVEEGEPIANIKLALDGETIYEGDLLAASGIEARSFETDMKYHFEKFVDAAISLKALPFWLGGAAAVLVAIRLAVMLHRHGQRRRNPYRFTRQGRK